MGEHSKPPHPKGLQAMNTTKIINGVAIARLAGAVGVIALQASPAFVANEIINTSCTMLGTIKNWLFGAVYILGAIGLVLIAISAFLGRFKFAHLISLGGGLFVVAMADLLIDFVTQNNDDQSSCARKKG